VRALFEDTKHAAADAKLRVTQIGLDVADTDKRDIYLHVLKTAGNDIGITAYATRAEAQAGSGTALDTWTISAYPVAGTYVGAVLGIVLHLDGTVEVGDALNSVWCYTCAPDLVAMDNVRDILREYVGSGGALEGFLSGDIVAGDVPAASPDHEIRIFTELIERNVQRDTKVFWGPQTYTLDVVLRHASLDDEETDGMLREETFKRLRRWQAMVESIVADERRNSFTLSQTQGPSAAAWRWIESIPPTPVEEPDGHFLIAISRYQFTVESMWADLEYPRT
jgi:hypothetical protein